MSRSRLILAMCLAGQTALVLAGPLKGEGEVGYTQTSGNTKTSSLNAKLSLSKDVDAWSHRGELGILSAATDAKTTAESYTLKARTKYRFAGPRYGFASLRYENDRFSGYDYQGALVIGLGTRLIENARGMTLDADAGIGGRTSQDAVTGKSSQEAVLLINGNFAAPLSDSATFSEDLSIEGGSDNTYIESVTGLKLKVMDDLAAKIAYTVKRNSSVPAGTKQTDLQTAVTLVYAF